MVRYVEACENLCTKSEALAIMGS